MLYTSAGHHLKDPGAVANGFTEFIEMDRFRNKLVEYLSEKGYPYVTDDNKETNTQYQSRIKPQKGDVVIDLHLNASSNPLATGCEVFISNHAGEKSKALAKELVDSLSDIMGIHNRGVKTESQSPRKRLPILNKKGMAALIEFCFISNKKDMESFHKNENLLVKTVGDIIIKYDENK